MNLCVIDDADAKRHGHGNLLLLLVLCVMASNIVDMVRSIILLLDNRRGRLLGLCIVIDMFYLIVLFLLQCFAGIFYRRPNLILIATIIHQ